MDDPKSYRDNAKRCIEMANDAINTATQSSLFEMAKSWTRLAEQAEHLERGQAIRERWRSNGAEPHR